MFLCLWLLFISYKYRTEQNFKTVTLLTLILKLYICNHCLITVVRRRRRQNFTLLGKKINLTFVLELYVLYGKQKNGLEQ